MIKSEIFSSFTLFISAADLASTLLITKWNILKSQLSILLSSIWKNMHQIGLRGCAVIICLNKCHFFMLLCCLSPDSNTSSGKKKCIGTYTKTWQVECTINNIWSQFAKEIHMYRQKHCMLLKGPITNSEQKHNTGSNTAEDVKNKVNYRLNKELWSHEK